VALAPTTNLLVRRRLWRLAYHFHDQPRAILRAFGDSDVSHVTPYNQQESTTS